MARQEIVRLAAVTCAVLALAGCQEGKGPFAAGKDASEETITDFAATGQAATGREVEAPGVFNLTGSALWDGRPSLGGVWVAHSSVTDPERVIIRNTANGDSVIGALFRRERESPGPGVQVSSDAADALGMLAGQPADLTIVALRREEVPVAPEAPAVAAAPAAADEAATTETAAADIAPADAVPAADAAIEGGVVAADVAAATAEPAAEEPKRKGLFGFLRKKPKPEPEIDATADVAGGSIEQSTLDPVTVTAAAGIANAEAAAASQPAPAAALETLKRAYVQIGIFSTEENANRASGQMKSAGMTATVMPDESQGKKFWRVIIGPAASVAERDALAAKVKSVGYPDAYPVSK